jgi:hypothetical protein
VEGSDRDIIRCIIPTFTLRDWGRSRSSSRIIAEIRTEYLPNISAKNCLLLGLIGIWRVSNDTVAGRGGSAENPRTRSNFPLLLWSESPATVLIQSVVLWRNWLLRQALWAMCNHAQVFFSHRTHLLIGCAFVQLQPKPHTLCMSTSYAYFDIKFSNFHL